MTACTQTDVDNHMAFLSDEQLLNALKVARKDLEDAAKHHHETEWHEACFAGAVCYAIEVNKRGISLGDAK